MTVIGKQRKAIENGRLEATKPVRDELSEIKKECDSVTQILNDCQKELKSMIQEYRDEQFAKEQAAAEKARKENDRRANISKGLGGEGIPKNFVPVPQETFKDRDSTRTRKEWKHKVVDKEKLPHKYLLVDNVGIRDAMRAAVKAKTIEEFKIPGVEFYQEENIIG